jgi:hypothetical protein
MKKIKYILFLATLFSMNLYALMPPSVGVLTKVIQTVDYKSGEAGDWDPAKLGGILYDGDELRTGDRSLALLKFLDNSLLRVRENSIVTIYGTKEDSKLSKNTFIQQGKVGFDITEQEDQEFKFTTPTGVASIRGTKGFFDVPLDGSMILFVKEGLVEIESLLGSKATGSVGGGQLAKITPDGELSIVQADDKTNKEFDAVEKDSTKRIRIKLDNGDEYILEYLE